MKLSAPTESTRAWIYRILLAVLPLLTLYGVVSGDEAAHWAVVISAILSIGGNTLAASNTSTKPPHQ